MSISTESELLGMQAISHAVAVTLKKMREYAQIGMTTKELDDFGGEILSSLGAKSAPKLTYNFPGWTCICVNKEAAHGIPSAKKILREGDLVNIDVSAEMGGFWADNGGSFVLGRDIYRHQPLVDVSKQILWKAISRIKSGVKIADIGHLVEMEAKKKGYKVIENLAGHGVGRSLHEYPEYILNYRDPSNRQRFKKDMVVAIETFISTRSSCAVTQKDGWTMIGDKGGFVTQHEHTIVVTDREPIILTKANEIWN